MSSTRGNLKSGFNRKNKGSPAIAFTDDEFCKWRKQQELRCYYCGIAQVNLGPAGLVSQVQKPLRVIGIDRLDSAGGYDVSPV